MYSNIYTRKGQSKGGTGPEVIASRNMYRSRTAPSPSHGVAGAKNATIEYSRCAVRTAVR